MRDATQVFPARQIGPGGLPESADRYRPAVMADPPGVGFLPVLVDQLWGQVVGMYGTRWAESFLPQRLRGQMLLPTQPVNAAPPPPDPVRAVSPSLVVNALATVHGLGIDGILTWTDGGQWFDGAADEFVDYLTRHPGGLADQVARGITATAADRQLPVHRDMTGLLIDLPDQQFAARIYRAWAATWIRAWWPQGDLNPAVYTAGEYDGVIALATVTDPSPHQWSDPSRSLLLRPTATVNDLRADLEHLTARRVTAITASPTADAGRGHLFCFDVPLWVAPGTTVPGIDHAYPAPTNPDPVLADILGPGWSVKAWADDPFTSAPTDTPDRPQVVSAVWVIRSAVTSPTLHDATAADLITRDTAMASLLNGPGRTFTGAAGWTPGGLITDPVPTPWGTPPRRGPDLTLTTTAGHDTDPAPARRSLFRRRRGTASGPHGNSR